MALVTFQILDGMERGLIYADIPTPFTIGREEDNAIQLNDERVSRFHVKIQEDKGRIILTDLDSTNGTRVNGRPVQLHVLEVGDHISLGRCLLVFGSPEEILARARELNEQGEESAAKSSGGKPAPTGRGQTVGESQRIEEGYTSSNLFGVEEVLFPFHPPSLPRELPLAQRAQLADLLAFIHDELRMVIEAGEEANSKAKSNKPRVVDWHTWQQLLRLEMQVAAYLRQAAEPDQP